MSDQVETIQELKAQLATCKADSQRAARIQSALYEIADAASATTDLQAFYVTLHGIIARLMYARNFLIATYEEKSGILSFPYHVDEKEVGDESWLPEVYKENKGATSYVMRTGKSLHTSSQNAKLIESGELEIIGTEPEDGIFAPLKADGKMLGAIAVQSYSKGIGYSEDDVQVLTFVAQHVSTALTQARAIEETRQRNNELAILNSVGEAMSKTLDVKNVAHIVGDTVRDIFKADAIAIYLLDDQSNIIHPAYVFDKGEGGYIDYIPPFPLGKGLTSKVIQSRKPLMLGTVEEQNANGGFLAPEAEEKGSGISTQSWLAVPILAGDRVLGIVNVSEYRAHAYNESHVRLLETLSANMGVAIENARLFEAEQQRSNELAILNSVGEAMSKTMDVKTMTRIVGDKVRDIFNADGVSIMLLDSATNLIHTHYEFDKGEGGYIDYIEPFPLGKGLTTEVIKSRQPLLLNTLEEQGAHGGYIAPESIERGSGITAQSWLGVPITVGEKVLGVTTITNYRPRAFNEAHQRLLETLASNMGVAIENARLFEAEQQRTAELQIINAIQEGLASQLDFNAIIDLVGDKIREIFDSQVTFIALHDPESNSVSYPYMLGPLNGVVQRAYPPPSSPEGFSGQVIRTRQTIVINKDMDRRSEEAGSDLLVGDINPKSAMYVPIQGRERVIGVISLQNMDRENAFPDNQVHLLETVANAMSVALENARLFKAEQQRAGELAIINSVQEGLASKLDYDAIVDLVGEKIREIFDAQSISIGRYDHANSLVDYSYLVQKGKRVQTQASPFAGMSKHMINTQQTLVLNENVVEWGTENGVDWGTDFDIPRSAVYVPLLVGKTVTGVITIANLDRENAFRQSDVSLLETLAGSMSVALENARLFDETQRLFKAEQQRAAELAIINSVQEGLVSKLDFQSIVDLVGDKLREVLNTQEIGIRLYDVKADLMHYLYEFEHGERLTIQPMKPSKLFQEQQKSLKPIFGKTMEISERFGLTNVPGTEISKSMVNVPIIAGNQAIGGIAVEDYTLEDAFNESNVRLLQTVAASMGAALENARLFDETQRLFKSEQQRVAELAIINSVQDGLASKLDMQAIYDLVGDKIHETFPDSQVVDILTYDHNTAMLYPRYVIEKGKRYEVHPWKAIGFRKHVVETGKTMVINRNMESLAAEFNNPVIVGEMAKSAVYVPMTVGGQVLGVMSLQHIDREEAFSDSDVRLLETLASSMSVALENARLFEETQRLLKETEQRAAELAIINSVQEGLASKLEMQAIYDLVGEKIRTVFDAEVVNFVTYDRSTDLLTERYSYEKGDRTLLPPALPSYGFRKHVIKTRQPLVINRDTVKADVEFGNPVLQGAQPKASIFVPMIAGDEVTGIISLQNLDHEDAFSDSDVHLLQTLANSMSVALENASLFDETQRLFKAEQQRAAELAIITSVQEGLASKLEMQAIYDLVGEKVRTVFDAQVVNFVTYDRTTDMLTERYSYEKGDRTLLPEPMRVYGFRKHVVETHQTLVLNRDNEKAGVEFGNPVLYGAMSKSAIFVPMIAGPEVTGILSLQNLDHEDAFSDSDVHLLQTLANSMSVALENARLFDETQRLFKAEQQRAAELSVINSVQKGLASKLDMQAIYDLVGDKIRDIFKTEVVYIAIRDTSRAEQFDFPYYLDRGNRLVVEFVTLGEGITSRVVETKQPVVAGTMDRQRELGGIYDDEEQSLSYLGVPIFLGDKVMGVASVQSYQANAFGDADVRLLSTLAASMGVALENARLFDEVQKRNSEITEALEQQTATSDILRVIAGSPTNVQPVLDAVAESAARLCQSYDAAIARVEGGVYKVVAHWGPVPVPSGQTSEGVPLTLETVTGRAILERRSIHVDDVLGEEGAEYPLSKETSKISNQRTLLATPLMREGRAIGAIFVRRQEVNPFTNKQAALLNIFADQAAIAIENVRLFDETTRLLKETEQRAAELAIINSVQDGLATKLDIQAIYDLVGDKVKETFAADTTYICAFNASEQSVYFHYYVEKGQYNPPGPIPFGQGLFTKVIQSRLPIVVSTSHEAHELGSSVVASPGGETDLNESGLFVPIMLRDEIRGVVSVQSYRKNAYTDNDLRLLTTLAGSMSVALENARLFDEVQKRNSEITEALEQQTATSEVFSVIAGSPTNVRPVLDAVARSAAKLCDANDVQIYQVDGDKLRQVSHHGPLPALQDGEALPLVPGLLTGRAVLERRTIHTEDVSKLSIKEYPESVKLQERLGHKTTIVTPLLREGKAIGAIVVRRNVVQPFTDKQVGLLSTFADQAAIAIENVRLFNETTRLLKETEQRAAELGIINSVQAALAAELNIQGIYDAVGDKIRGIFHQADVQIRILDPKTNFVYFPYLYEKGKRLDIQGIPLPEHGFGPYVLRTRKTLVINANMTQETEKYGSYIMPGTEHSEKSAVFVPLVVGDRARGLISLADFEQENAFSESDVRLLETLANSMSVALENARLFDETQRLLKETEQRAAELAIINSVQEGLASKLDMQAIYEIVGSKILEIFQAQDVIINTYDEVEGKKHTRYYIEEGVRFYPADIELSELHLSLIRNRKTLIFNTNAEEEILRLGASNIPGAKPDRSVVYVPLFAGNRVFGSISLHNANVDNAFSESDVRLLQTLASSMSVALENARLFDETQRLLKETEQRAAELAIINSVQEGLASKLEMQAIYDLVGDKIREIFNVQSILIVTYEKATNTSTFSYNYEKGVRYNPDPRPASGISGHVIKTRQPILINDHYAERENEILGEPTEILAGEDIKARLDVPMLVGGEATGVISLQNIDRENAFSDSDLRLLQTLAASMSVALENARLFDETQRLLKETEQRAAELAIINSVQEGLASKLEMQAIYDLIGDKIRDIFHDMDLGIRIYDPATNMMHYPYTREKGQRIEIASEVENKKGFAWHVLETRQTMLINENMGQIMEAYGSYALPGTEMEKSLLMVPLMAGGQARGILSLLSMERENAFSDSDVRLLQTLAGSMSVALENARLFDETQRLLKETDQRAAELAIINGVQEGLASKLEMQAIYDLVGEKIRNVFDSQAVTIALYDRPAEVLRFPYYLHRGRRLPQEPIKFGEGLTSHLIRTRQPLLINKDAEKRYAELGAVFVTGDDNAKSWLGVPIVSGSEATGAIFLQNYERENAYSESDMRLLSTIATSMGVALENARLFDETQRLLKETDQRATELALINSVQEGLAAKLEELAIYELVGDKIRDLHLNVDVGIRIFDRKTNLIHYPYLREKGKRIEIQPQPLGDKGFSAEVLRSRQTLVINENMAQTLEQYGSYVLPGTEMTKSAVYAPLFIGGQVEGIVSLGSFERELAFSEADVRLLQTLAGSMGIALEKARLFEAEKQRAAELSAISTVSQALVAETELESMIQLIGNQLRDIFDADILYVALLNQQMNIIEFPYEFGQELGPLPMGEGLTSKIIETRQPILINQDIEKQVEEIGAKRVGKDARSYLGVPILSGRQAIGAISVQSTREENAFNEDDLRLLSTIAANAGAAIQTARLHSETQHHAQEMATLAEIGNDIASSRELEPVLNRIAAHAKNILHVRDIAIRLIDSDGETLTTSVALGTYTAEIKADVLRLGEGLTGAIAASGIAEFVNEPTRDPRVRHVAGTPEEDDSHESMMVAPLISRGQTIGVISVWRPHENGLFTQQELDFLVSVARQTAIAIESARLYLETQRRANEMSALAEVGREISASLDPTVVLDKISSRAMDLLAGSSSAVFLMNPDNRSMRTVTALGELAEAIETDVIQVGEGIIGSLALEGKSEFVNGTNKDPRSVIIPGTDDEDTTHENLMAAPLFRGAEVTGMMAVWRKSSPFNETDLNFLNGLARQASSALENARLFEEIKAEKQYSEALVQNSPVAIVSIDVNGSVVEWNPGAEKLFGYPAQEAIGRHIDDLVAKDAAIRVQAEAYSKHATEPGQIQTITQRTRKDGTVVDVELSGVPVIAEGKRIGMLGIYHDITELQRARQEAIAANEAKSAFLATMSHEIRTPMNAVIGMSGLLMDTQLNKEQHDYAETIRNSGDALLAIINDILDFSKIEAGKMDLEHQPFDLRECVESALDLVAGRAVEKIIDLAYIIEDEVPTGIKGDVTRLRQILLNLLSNAVKFTEKGEVVLTVKKDALENGLRVSVRDSGIGIPADRMGRLFESFSQADSSTTRRFGGTGLGLVISKRLVEMMGGTMWAESAGAGKGSTFTFTMSAEPAKVAERKTARDIKGVQPSLQGKRVLIVDDNGTNRRILMLQTEKWGMAPRETELPSEALKWLKADEPFDLAILDLQMPEMDGLMLTRELRKLRDAKALPIILLTSLGRKEVGAQDLDIAAYLLKPLKPSGLFDALASIFARNIVSPQLEPVKASMDPEMGRTHPLRILLAEDNAVNQKLALRLLEQMGYRADVASNGLEAVESVERQPYDVILMDMQMPEMDGLDATRAIRKLQNVAQPRIVAMTANAMQGDRELCLAAGMDDYVSKPIRVPELVAALRQANSAEAEVIKPEATPQKSTIKMQTKTGKTSRKAAKRKDGGARKTTVRDAGRKKKSKDPQKAKRS